MEKSPIRLFYYASTLVLMASAALMSSLGFHKVVYYLVIASSFCIYQCSRSDNIFHIFWLLGFFTFVFLPYFSVYPLSPRAISEGIIIISIIYTTFALFITSNYSIQYRLDLELSAGGRFTSVIIFSAAASLGIILMFFLGLSANLIFVLLTALLYFLLRGSTLLTSTTLLGVYLLTLALYSFFIWSGFGRINIAIWTLGAITLYLLRFEFRIGKLIVILAAFVGPSMLAIIRGRGGLAEQFLSGIIDSNLSPILLATDLARNSDGEVGGVFDLLGQFSLILVTFVPREIFPDKPNAFGFEYTLRELDDYSIQVGHSVAGLFMGDHLFFLGPIGFATTFFSVLVVCIIYILAIRSSRLHLLGVMIALQLPTFIWVGIGLFAQRLSLSLFGMISATILYIFVKRLVRPRKRAAFIRSKENRHHFNQEPESNL